MDNLILSFLMSLYWKSNRSLSVRLISKWWANSRRSNLCWQETTLRASSGKYTPLACHNPFFFCRNFCHNPFFFCRNFCHNPDPPPALPHDQSPAFQGETAQVQPGKRRRGRGRTHRPLCWSAFLSQGGLPPFLCLKIWNHLDWNCSYWYHHSQSFLLSSRASGNIL